ncbi:DUF3034 family protein [Caulobacter sp. RHG1]|uniref:DUF3034 family protein n=1 Tax=Caulobacter sp. (strain RHG1) TaxID=2545762 RepID=UPI00155692E7|nr:DUF3034 family protein [Caulobacter sp. RHG1]NQE60481.1 hypothetical protein [Caulobacter sp. RHG1]
MKRLSKTALAAMALGVCAAGGAHAGEIETGGKLLLTHGVSAVEGGAGGGLTSWAVIAGNETNRGVGGEVHGTYVDVKDYKLRAFGGAVGWHDRVELSAARQEFDTGATGAKLGLGKGFTFKQTVLGAKVKVLGDAVYEQDSWVPQIAVGVQYKDNNQDAIVRAVGAKKDSGVDVYVAATKLLLDKSLVLNGTVRLTKANQMGLLGFGGDQSNAYKPQFEGSAGYLLSKRLVVGAEYRTKPSNLGFAKEDDWKDLFVAYAVNKSLSVTAAYVDLGDIATFKNQRGLYLSLQAGF